MKFETWEAIAKRHLWFKQLLVRRMDEYPESVIDDCTDMEVLARVIELTERVERHEARIARHMELALAHVEPASRANH